MATWTLQTMDDAKAKHQFIMVTPTGVPLVTIRDSQAVWRRNPDIVFQTGYRIAGTPTDIATALTPLGVTPDDVQDLMNTAVTRENYQAVMAPVYQEELDSYYNWKRSVMKANIDGPGVKLFDVMVAVNPDVLHTVKATKEGKTLGIGRAKGTRARKAKSLVDIIAALPAGKVLDVSELTADGTGTKKINPPTRSKKYGSPNLPIVSADLQHYIMAINMLPGGQEQYAADVDYVRRLFEQGGKLTTGAILTVPGTATILGPVVPQVPMPTTAMVPQVPRTPTAVAPIMQGTEIPQNEIIEPTKVFPMFTRRQREQIKKADNAAKGIAPLVTTRGAILPVPGAIPIPTLVPGIAPVTVPAAPNVQLDENSPDIDEETGEPEDDSDDEDNDFDDEDNDFDDEDDSPLTLGTVMPPLATAVVVPTVPQVPTVPNTIAGIPNIPALAQVPQVTVPLVPVMPTPQAVPRTPTIPVMPTPQAVPRTPTIPVIPTPQMAPRTPTIPVMPTPQMAPRTPMVPTIPQL